MSAPARAAFSQAEQTHWADRFIGSRSVLPMRRVALVAAGWFALWMTLRALAGYLAGGPHGGKANGLYCGIFNGAWLALLTSFAWPWIMPKRIDDWMWRAEAAPVARDDAQS
jgi:hypothetical protein